MKRLRFTKGNTILLFIALAIIVLYFATRLFHLTSLPIFTDEAIYIRWAQISMQDSAQRFISLTDGKQPLFIWAMAPFFKLFRDPLVAGRLVSVFSGFGTVIGMFLLGRETCKNKSVGIMSSLLYVVFPLALVHDRMALYDSMVGMFFVWSLYFTLLLVRYVRFDTALVLSMITGGGLLTKSSNEINLALIPISVLLFDFSKKLRKERFGKWVLFAIIAIILAYAYYSILRLSPYFYIINQKNATFNYPIREWLHHPFTYLVGNFKGYGGWFVEYMTIPVVLLVIASFFLSRKRIREKLFLLIAFVLPFTYAVFFGKVLYPRYLLFMCLPLLVLAAYSIVQIYQMSKTKTLVGIVLAVFLLPAFITELLVINNFVTAPIPQSDRNQYAIGWSSGAGVKEAVDYLREKAITQKMYVATEGTFGLMPFAVEIYLKNNPNVTIQGYWPIKDTPPQAVLDAAKHMPTYFIFYESCPSCGPLDTAPASWHMKQILQVKKPGGADALTLYEVE